MTLQGGVSQDEGSGGSDFSSGGGDSPVLSSSLANLLFGLGASAGNSGEAALTGGNVAEIPTTGSGSLSGNANSPLIVSPVNNTNTSISNSMSGPTIGGTTPLRFTAPPTMSVNSPVTGQTIGGSPGQPHPAGTPNNGGGGPNNSNGTPNIGSPGLQQSLLQDASLARQGKPGETVSDQAAGTPNTSGSSNELAQGITEQKPQGAQDAGLPAWPTQQNGTPDYSFEAGPLDGGPAGVMYQKMTGSPPPANYTNPNQPYTMPGTPEADNLPTGEFGANNPAVTGAMGPSPAARKISARIQKDIDDLTEGLDNTPTPRDKLKQVQAVETEKYKQFLANMTPFQKAKYHLEYGHNRGFNDPVLAGYKLAMRYAASPDFAEYKAARQAAQTLLKDLQAKQAEAQVAEDNKAQENKFKQQEVQQKTVATFGPSLLKYGASLPNGPERWAVGHAAVTLGVLNKQQFNGFVTAPQNMQDATEATAKANQEVYNKLMRPLLLAQAQTQARNQQKQIDMTKQLNELTLQQKQLQNAYNKMRNDNAPAEEARKVLASANANAQHIANLQENKTKLDAALAAQSHQLFMQKEQWESNSLHTEVVKRDLPAVTQSLAKVQSGNAQRLARPEPMTGNQIMHAQQAWNAIGAAMNAERARLTKENPGIHPEDLKKALGPKVKELDDYLQSPSHPATNGFTVEKLAGMVKEGKLQ